MKPNLLVAAALILLSFSAARPVTAQLSGEPYIHDPSTVVYDNGKYYTFGTGSGGLISDDGGWTWHTGAVRTGGGVAPDIIKIGDKFFVAYAVGGGGMSGGHASNVKTMWTKTLDPKSPDFGYHDDSVVASSNGVEDADAIDPAFLYAQGHLWLSYGTYFGFIRILELDPKTAKRLPASKPVDVAIDMEATDMMYHDGWYYLLGTHGTCCDGANSTYNIRAGRSRKPTGPFVDNEGIPLLKGGGKLVVAASGRHMGPGHFGLLDLGDGVQKFSMHYEADLDRSGRSILDIRPLLWKDGWPVGGENFQEGTYQIQSERSGFALQLAVDFVRMDNGRGRPGGGPGAGGGVPRPAGAAGAPVAGGPPAGGPGAGAPGGGFNRAPQGPPVPIPNQQLAQVQGAWPTGTVPVDMIDYMVRPNQEWKITSVADVGGYPGSPYFKIQIAGTERTLAAADDGSLVALPAYSGTPEQLWRIDQLTDGTYRVMPKSMSDAKEPLVLTAVGASTPTLARFDPKSDKGRWDFRKP
jgi:arabinan endo-1,5-alpha-L-arabinosidase